MVESVDREVWPEQGLEYLGCCPVCSESRRKLLFDALSDRIFFCAPGKWKMYRCAGCGCGYLDPRPDRESLHLAYRDYYTHGIEDMNLWRRFRHWIVQGYWGHSYGMGGGPARYLGALTSWLFPGKRAVADALMRHLPLPAEGARLLDLGCGNGMFLARAVRVGWDAVGVDPDPRAVEAARRCRLKAYVGDMAMLADQEGLFDIITMNHVIEHVHDPVDTLRRCRKLLKPGGRVWVETPNLDSRGCREYGVCWRGLEPPRHLVLFTKPSLEWALREAGFGKLETLPWRPLCLQTFSESEAIRLGADPLAERDTSLRIRWKSWLADREAKRDPLVREFITLVAGRD